MAMGRREMTTVAEVRLWGSLIGAVAYEDGAAAARFQYNPEFLESGIEVSPLTMPLSSNVYEFPALSHRSFHGLPGLLADSLPDTFGNAVINAWLASTGRPNDSLNPVERLCYTGVRGMGALEFSPTIGPQATTSSVVYVDRLVELAAEVLAHRDNLEVSFEQKEKAEALRDILRVSTSAGGARAKAVVAWNEETGEVRSGQVASGEGFTYWVLKFDGVSGNRDKEMNDPLGYGAIEYAYHRMALDAGIEMVDCRLLEEGGRRHFMTRRFDRSRNGDKIHMQSLGGIAHYDYNEAGAYGYEQSLDVIRRLDLGMEAIESQFRRMIFNVVSRNQDDHVKNIAFLMDRSGAWSLAPAFDVTYAYQPDGLWTSRHQMTINGKQDDFTMQDFEACARSASMKRGRASAIVDEVQTVVSRWREYADEVGVHPKQRDAIQKALRLEPVPG
jgi:serine/threonine-protein kinase HipA